MKTDQVDIWCPVKEPHSMAEPPLVVVVAAVYFKKADQYLGPANDEKGVPAKASQ
jgi:hypothetical protein